MANTNVLYDWLRQKLRLIDNGDGSYAPQVAVTGNGTPLPVSGTVTATVPNPLPVSGTVGISGTVPVSGPITVAPVGVSLPISGTVAGSGVFLPYPAVTYTLSVNTAAAFAATAAVGQFSVPVAGDYRMEIAISCSQPAAAGGVLYVGQYDSGFTTLKRSVGLVFPGQIVATWERVPVVAGDVIFLQPFTAITAGTRIMCTVNLYKLA